MMSANRPRASQIFDWLRRRSPAWLLTVIPLVYLLTLARTPVLGDPSEYTFVAHVTGIAHPPGYAFMAVMGKLFQTLIPIGSIAWRTHLLAASAATLSAVCVYGLVRTAAGLLAGNGWERQARLGATLAGLYTAFNLAGGPNQWQHAIHANPHIITATFLAANLFFLTRWYAGQGQKQSWLLAFCFSAGLGVTHHPLTVFAFPAYAIFILLVRPHVLKEWRLLLKMIGMALLGLALWLYFPLASSLEPVFGPHDMDTVDGFLNVVLARGLRINLFHFGLADQPDRALVFWSTLRLQYRLAALALVPLGVYWLARRSPRLLALYGLAFLGNAIFVINSVQDVMAYLLGPFLIVGLFAGFGLFAVLELVWRRMPDRPGPFAPQWLLAGAFFLLGPALQIVRTAPLVSLHDYSAGQDHIEAIFAQFEGTGQEAILLHDWEHMTPMWYSRWVDDRWPNPADVRPVFVASNRTWVEMVFDYLTGGPLYVTQYNPEIVAAGFRLRPEGAFYRVVEEDHTIPPSLQQFDASENVEAAIVAYALPERTVTAGDFVALTLAMRSDAGADSFFAPVLQVGDIRFPFTTDNHVVSPLWRPGEVIVERFDFALPHNLAEGSYPLTVQLFDLLANESAGPLHELGELQVEARDFPAPVAGLLANFRQRVGLVRATASAGWERRSAIWTEPLPVEAGDTIDLTLTWRSLALPEDSYVVFIHLIDAANQPHAGIDYTPLGGAAPTYLWIPRWLPGQQYVDPYRLRLLDDLPPGDYSIEVGMYEMARGPVGGRRLNLHDVQGNIIGDRFILGPVQVR